MAYSADEFARYIITKFQEAGDPVSNLKLQKLLYYVQGWHLVLRGGPAFPESLKAWVHGPVVSNVYGNYKHYRWNPIAEMTAPSAIDAETAQLVDSVLEAYGGETGYQLELRTHAEPPWVEARGSLSPDQESQEVISLDTMRQFFERLNRAQ